MTKTRHKPMEKLAKIRRKQGLNQKELAEKCGLQWETISQYERGVRTPSLQSLTQLAEALGCGLEELIEK